MDVIVRVQQERRNVEQKIPALRKELAELEKAAKYLRGVEHDLKLSQECESGRVDIVSPS